MGTGRKFNKKPVSRPRKGTAERRQRDKSQKKRLLALGMDPEVVRTMDSKTARGLVQKPQRVTAA